MSCNKRKLDTEDEVKCSSFASKRTCGIGDSVSTSSESMPCTGASLRERRYTDEEQKRVLAILEREFDRELEAKKEEAIEIQQRIQKAQKVLQYLCYAVVSDFYSREKTISSVVSTRQRRIHPAVKKLLSGKSPAGLHHTITADAPVGNTSTLTNSVCKLSDNQSKDKYVQFNNDSQSISEDCMEKKVPRYIPPKPNMKISHTVPSEPIRGGKNKVRTLLLVGNVSKWIPPDSREDAVTHKWMVYVRGPKEAPDISGFVSKVRFFLHPSYRPNDVVQVVCPPFQLSRRGWGEFPVRVQIHFSNPLNKPVDIIHNLKLDRTYSGLQTLGAETVAEVWILRNKLQENVQLLDETPTSEECENTLNECQRVENQDLKHSSIDKVEKLRSTAVNLCQEVGNQDLTPLTSYIKEEPKSPTLSLTHSDPDTSAFSSVSCKSEPVDSEQVCSTWNNKQEICAPISGSDGVIKQVQAVSSPETLSSSSNARCSSTMKSVIIDQASLPQEKTVAGETPRIAGQDVSRPIFDAVDESKPSVNSTAATRLVKCVDSKGTVRLIKMNSDILEKLLKSNSTHIGKQVTATQPPPLTISSKAVNPRLSTPLNNLQVNQPTATHFKTSSVPQNTSPKIHSPAPGISVPTVRPVFRLLRPAGNVKAGTVLLANPGVSTLPQTPTLSRFTSPANEDRPVVVIKDGKLLLMKNVVSTNVSNTSSLTNNLKTSVVPMKAMPGIISQSGLQVKVQSIQGTPDSSVNKNITNSSSITTTTRKTNVQTNVVASPSSVIMTSSALEPVTNGVGLQKQLFSRSVSTHVTASRSVLSSSCVQPTALLNTKSPVSCEKIMQVKKNDNSVMIVSNTSAPHSKPSTALPSRSIIKPGMSLLKAGVSLLKTNATGSASCLSNVSPQTSPNSLTQTCKTQVVSSPQSPALKRIILGKSTGSSAISTTSLRTQLYEEKILHAVRSCPRGVEENMGRAVRWMMRVFPLVHVEAHLNEYKMLHPYCAPTEKIFCSWNIGKQRACEWLRAKAVHQSLIRAGWEAQSVWTIREIVLWARFHGYTPGLPVCTEKELEGVFEESEHEDCNRRDPYSVCMCTEPLEAEKWLKDQENSLPLNTVSEDKQMDESGEEIDIMSCDTSPSKVPGKEDLSKNRSEKPIDNMPLEPSLHGLAQLVSDTLKQCGFKNLSHEEISPGVLYPAAQRMIIQAVQSLVEDITRRAFADAWGENVVKQPSRLGVKNVCEAILSRPELDLFTCFGLGICSEESSKN